MSDSIFVLSWQTTDKVQVRRFPTRPEASSFAELGLPMDTSAVVVETVDDLVDWTHAHKAYAGSETTARAPDPSPSSKLLVELYNAITPDAHVNKFSDRATGRERLFKQLQLRYGDQAYEAAAQPAVAPVIDKPDTKKEESMSKTHESGAAVLEKEPEVATKRRGRPGISGEAKITVLAEKNPCRPDTRHFEHFELYRTGMTVQEFLDAGGIPGDVRYDKEHGYISVE